MFVVGINHTTTWLRPLHPLLSCIIIESSFYVRKEVFDWFCCHIDYLTSNSCEVKSISKGQATISKAKQKTKGRATRNPLKPCRVTLITNPVMIREWGKDRIVITTNGTYSSSNQYMIIIVLFCITTWTSVIYSFAWLWRIYVVCPFRISEGVHHHILKWGYMRI